MIKQLEDPSVEVRIAAARELGRRRAQDGRFQLEDRFIETEHPEELRVVTEVLAQLQPDWLNHLRIQRRRRQDRDSSRANAKSLNLAQARQKIGDLAWALGGKSGRQGESPFHPGDSLIEIGLAVPEVIPDLINLLKTKPALRELLTKVLKAVGRERPKEVGEAVVPLLQHQDPSIAEAAEDVFSTTTTTEACNDDAIPDLMRRYDSKEEGDAEAGMALLLRATTNSVEVVDGILERIKAHEESGRSSAWLALLYLIAQRRVRRAVAALTDLMLHGMVSVRCGALKAVGESSGPAGNRKVIAAVQASMKDGDESLRYCATLAAGNSSEKFAAELVPDLITAVDDPDPQVRLQALASLIRLRGTTPAADDAIWARFSSEDDLNAFVECALQRKGGSSPS